MALRPKETHMEIIKLGDQRLQKMCHPVTDFGEGLKTLVENLKTTCIESKGVGLAAPQIGVTVRAFVVFYPTETFGVFINPVITKRWGTLVSEEMCLSIPGVDMQVPRSKGVHIEACDIDGKEFKVKATDLLARILQHEMDHLDGRLIIDYLPEE